MKIQMFHRFLLLSLILASLLSFSRAATAATPNTSSTLRSQPHYSPSVPWFMHDDWNIKPVAPDDPNKPILDAEVASLVSHYNKEGDAKANVADPVKLQTGVLAHLFPNYKFYMISWDEEAVPGKENINRGMGIYYCLAISTKGVTTKFFGMSNEEEYGKFLSDNGVVIKSADDARQVWLALCDMTQLPLHSRDMVQVSPTEWHLGININNGWQNYCQLSLGADQKVVSAKNMSERAKN